ncbi:ATP synthase, F0 complex, subunit B [Nitrospina gracilis 3/211]|uniref:ATP synthase subunit b n=1 Tax=Nitrospina gracilis (strain 3/211) TaxID=1266370 RepID=M1Z1H1_NITG3|nr:MULTISPECIES: F0F1 ATP synthase subunit B [Nitrospina]MCF8724660.1 F-type H+-transporting ATPase subunit b [Nitrospina sp. Nb-3]CCQ91842.1 ATP synthase, F0 complex, subunit B [Nitrospina gracilis 3/211]
MPQLEQVSVFSSLIFWSIVSFALLLFLLKKYAFPPILQMLEERQKKISGDIQNAEAMRAEAEKIKKEFEDQLQTAHDKANTIVQLAHDESRKLQEKTLNETQAKVRQMQKEAEHEIRVARDKLMGEIRQYVSVLTIASTEKILRRTMQDDDKKRLVDESIDEVVRNLEKN